MTYLSQPLEDSRLTSRRRDEHLGPGLRGTGRPADAL